MSNPANDLFSPFQLGALQLPNRVLMAPMTRSRAGAGNVPTDLMALYYAQRASAGLIIGEGTQVSEQGVGYISTPGIHSAAQVAGWRRVTDAVHAAGGRIFAQLWHVGRASHPSFHGGQLPVAPSAIGYQGEVFTAQGMAPVVTPRALETGEVAGVVAQFRQGAENAKQAGFDGVELHGANGYLLDQFLLSSTNQRTDQYGGSVENRARFALEVAQAALDVFGADRVGFRVSPTLAFNDMHDPDKPGVFTYLAAQLSTLGLAYLHVIEAQPGHPMAPAADTPLVAAQLRKAFKGAFILNGGQTKATATAALAAGEADLVSFGVPFLANPDLPERLRLGTPLNEGDRATFYGGSEKGFTDYPVLTATDRALKDRKNFTLVGRAKSDTALQQQEGKNLLGDRIVFANPVFDEANKTQLGRDHGEFVLTDPEAMLYAGSFSLVLDGGTFTVQGQASNSAATTLAVTGGTGIFRGARGEVTLSPRNDQGSEFDVIVSLD